MRKIDMKQPPAQVVAILAAISALFAFADGVITFFFR
jgi:hypothetical protein